MHMDPSRRDLLAALPGTLVDPDDRLKELEKELISLREQVNRLSRTCPPVGTVAAWAGPWSAEREAELGWLLCDGRRLDKPEYAALRQALGGDRAPDYRGVFLRGLDRGRGLDPDRRPAIEPQLDTTRMPRVKFAALMDGKHTHVAPTRSSLEDGKWEVPTRHVASYDHEGGAPTTEHSGHTHEIGGGDPETRPVNHAVDYIIRFR